MSAKLGVLYWGENAGWGWTRKWCRARYLYIRWRELDGSRESWIGNIRDVSFQTHARGLTKSRRIRMAVQVASTMKVNVSSVLVGKAKGKRRFWNRGYEWEDNIEMDLIEIWPGSCNVYLGRTRIRIFCCEKFLEFLTSIRHEKFIEELSNQ
jgi:hypothetical protein